jgi:FAD-linked sulfhydryl oxidase
MTAENIDSLPSKAPHAGMPPGMVMGPDGKPCKVCTAFRYWKPPAKSTANLIKGQNTISGSHNGQDSTTAAPSYRSNEPPPGCPPDVEQLGRATWTFLHTTAAYYPEKPTPSQRTNMLMLLRSLPVLYPCTWCADDLGNDINRHPPDVSGRGALSRWLCERHNEVNEKLGKEKFNCAKVDERWKDGPPDGSCD